MTAWRVKVMPEAKKHLATIKDSKVQQGLTKALKRLEEDPDKRGKALRDDLIGFRSLRAIGQRYRIIYQVLADRSEVHIVCVGIRREGSAKDAYEMASQLLKANLIGLE